MTQYLLLFLLLITACHKEEVDDMGEGNYEKIDKSFVNLTDFEIQTDDDETYLYGVLYELKYRLGPELFANAGVDPDEDSETVFEWDDACKENAPDFSDITLDLAGKSRWMAAGHRVMENCQAYVKTLDVESSKDTEEPVYRTIATASYSSIDNQMLLSQWCEAEDFTNFKGQKFIDVSDPFTVCSKSSSSIQLRQRISYQASIETEGFPAATIKVSGFSMKSAEDAADCAFNKQDDGFLVQDCIYAKYEKMESQFGSFPQTTSSGKDVLRYKSVLMDANYKIIEGKIELIAFMGWTGEVVFWKGDTIGVYRLVRDGKVIRGEFDFKISSTSLKDSQQDQIQKFLSVFSQKLAQ